MLPELNIVNTIDISSPAATIWDALTNPEITKAYMFGCETESEWEIGSDLLWKGQYQGMDMIFVKGKILQLIPNQLLVYTVFDPNSTMADIPENHLIVTYQLHQKDGYTNLTVTQGDYNKVAEGERRYKESWNDGQGWNPILEEIKSICEAD
ncbi:MAG: SRPBCC domain-containing protein [Bacteroidota bacterium]